MTHRAPGLLHLITFDVVGAPLAEPRPRFFVTKAGKIGVHHDRKVDPWKKAVRRACQAALEQAGVRELVPSDVGVAAQLVFRMPRPRDHYRGRSSVLRPSAPTLHTTKPDGDNLAKAVLDCVGKWSPDAPKKGRPRVRLPSLVWCDDCQVARIEVLKLYADAEPGARITFSTIRGLNMHEDCFLEPHELTPGEALVLSRRRADMTQQEAADTFGASFDVYRSWEVGGVDCPKMQLGFLLLHEQCFVLRRRAGLRIADVARATGLSNAWVGECERGEVPVSDQLVAWWRGRILDEMFGG